MKPNLHKGLIISAAAAAFMVSMPAAARNADQNAQTQQTRTQAPQQKQQQDPLMVEPQDTAGNMIGQNIRNPKNEDVGMVEDILISPEGEAMKTVIRHDDFWGFGGEFVAVDYKTFRRNKALSLDKDMDLVTIEMPEDQIEAARRFAYTQEEAKEVEGNVQVMVKPDDAISTVELLETSLRGPDNEQLAEIENIVFENGKARQVILGIGSTLGMDQNLVAMDFDSLQFSKQDGGIRPAISGQKAMKLKQFQQSRQNNRG